VSVWASAGGGEEVKKSSTEIGIEYGVIFG